MLIGQSANENNEVMYGCYIVGRFWYFMVLKGREYAISKDFSASDEALLDIIQVLKKLRSIIVLQLGLTTK